MAGTSAPASLNTVKSSYLSENMAVICLFIVKPFEKMLGKAYSFNHREGTHHEDNH
jgi:hypothetical protein